MIQRGQPLSSVSKRSAVELLRAVAAVAWRRRLLLDHPQSLDAAAADREDAHDQMELGDMVCEGSIRLAGARVGK